MSDLLEKISCVVQELKDPAKSAQGYGYKYATLDQILKIMRPLWKKYGIAVLQHATLEKDNRIKIETIITDGLHERVFTSYYPVVRANKMNEAQAVGASITYARRYTLSSLFSIASEEDVDADINMSEKENPGSALEILSLIQKERQARGVKSESVAKWSKEKFGTEVASKLSIEQLREILKALKEGKIK